MEEHIHVPGEVGVGSTPSPAVDTQEDAGSEELSMSNNTPSLIQSLVRGRTEKDDAADRALDEALMQLSRAYDDNAIATAGVRRRQSSGTLKLVSVPEPGVADAE